MARPQTDSWDNQREILEKIVLDFNIEKEIDRKILREKIYRIMDALEGKYREILILKFFEDKDYKEISDILKMPLGTVASMMNRAKKKFREELQKQEKLISIKVEPPFHTSLCRRKKECFIRILKI